ncbi:hypothetical protein [Caulobacter phage Cr30]|uniref:hypothetical protein n=1 Tax=Caulobacter phage Cr30 TaxID=1357714 RepID=UPI0004A9B7DE|nr:hypothetical protein OZ74_gp193 [Caulobacter phage Cr30]AGS81150.1 hypothetical protein [Caulobacter phage Cr30]
MYLNNTLAAEFMKQVQERLSKFLGITITPYLLNDAQCDTDHLLNQFKRRYSEFSGFHEIYVYQDSPNTFCVSFDPELKSALNSAYSPLEWNIGKVK